MNLIFGDIKRKLCKRNFIQQTCNYTENTLRCDMLKIGAHRTAKNKTQEKALLYCENDNIAVAFNGEIYNGIDFNNEFPNMCYDIELIFNLYKKHGIQSFQKLDGLFSSLIIDFKKQKLFIVQDKHTSLDHIYYYLTKERFLFSSNIKILLKHINKKTSLNKDALPIYLKYSFVPGNNTLFKKIYKIPSQQILEYDFIKNDIHLNSLVYKCPKKIYKNKKMMYLHILDTSIKNRLKDISSKKVGFSLSAGYDTNLMLNRIIENKIGKNLILFSIGTKEKDSEIRLVRNIIREYKRIGIKITYKEYIINGSEIKNLPAIVFDYGEPHAEQGVILQSYLAKVMNKNKIDVCILGDAADENFESAVYPYMVSSFFKTKASRQYLPIKKEFENIFWFKNFTDNELHSILKQKYYSIDKCPENPVWVYINYCALKKIRMKYYDIMPRFPFLSNKFVDYVKENLSFKDKLDKSFHKKIVKQVLPKTIFKNIAKRSGATPNALLFSNEQFNRKLFAFLLKSKVAKQYFRISYIQSMIKFMYENRDNKSQSFTRVRVINNLYAIIIFVVWYKLFISTNKFLKRDKVNVGLLELLKNN